MGYTANKCHFINFLATTKCGEEPEKSFSHNCLSQVDTKQLNSSRNIVSEFEHKNYRKNVSF